MGAFHSMPDDSYPSDAYRGVCRMGHAFESEMKELITIVVFLIVAAIVWHCETSPRFKVGDCITKSESEKWEYSPIYQVVLVGERQYLYQRVPDFWIQGQDWIDTEREADTFMRADRKYRKVECPEELK